MHSEARCSWPVRNSCFCLEWLRLETLVHFSKVYLLGYNFIWWLTEDCLLNDRFHLCTSIGLYCRFIPFPRSFSRKIVLSARQAGQLGASYYPNDNFWGCSDFPLECPFQRSEIGEPSWRTFLEVFRTWVQVRVVPGLVKRYSSSLHLTDRFQYVTVNWCYLAVGNLCMKVHYRFAVRSRDEATKQQGRPARSSTRLASFACQDRS